MRQFLPLLHILFGICCLVTFYVFLIADIFHRSNANLIVAMIAGTLLLITVCIPVGYDRNDEIHTEYYLVNSKTKQKMKVTREQFEAAQTLFDWHKRIEQAKYRHIYDPNDEEPLGY